MNSSLNDLQKAVAEPLERVNSVIAERMQSENAPRIPEVTKHLVGAGGKRLRPMLTLAFSNMFEYAGDADVKLAAAVEFIHTATLLHDDVVDESGQRRGRPTANLLWDNKSSVLVGDYLFSRAFQLMVETESLHVLDILANASAVIAEGEVLQLSTAQNINTSHDTYIQVVRGKTAALFSAACKAGTVVAGASAEYSKSAYDYGDALGICFQIVDDILDYDGKAERLGKNIGDDFRERKMTLPVILAVQDADQDERDFWQRTIGDGKQSDDDLDKALSILAAHNAINAARDQARSWASKAKSALELLPDSKVTMHLEGIADYIVSRVN